MKKKQKIFFLIQITEQEKIPYSTLSKLIKGIKFENHAVFEWTFKTEKREKEYKDFLTFLSKNLKPEYNSSIYETLLYYACKNNDKKEYDRLLKKYSDLAPFMNEVRLGVTGRFVSESTLFIFQKQ